MILLTATLGLEGAVSLEVKKLGYRILRSESGRVFIDAGYRDIPIFNSFLRSAERVLYVVGNFKARTFDELYDSIKSLDWSFLKDPKIWVSKVRSVDSKLFSERAVQSVSMKAIVDGVRSVEGKIPYPVHVYLRRDRAVVAVDTSGEGLHKRGYRKKYSRAPLRETIAAALLILARYEDQPLHDPFCGSGTIPIEAALISKNIPPLLMRSFLSESWNGLGDVYEKLRSDALKTVREGAEIRCSDIDHEVLKVAAENAERARVNLKIENRDFRELKAWRESGKIVTNPPYGERLRGGVWKDIWKLFENFKGWELHLISPRKTLPKAGKPKKTTPFFNSGIKVYYLQYF